MKINNIALNEILNQQLLKKQIKYKAHYQIPDAEVAGFDQEEYLPPLPIVSKPALKNSAFLKMYMSKGERGVDRESVYNVGDNFTYVKIKAVKEKDLFYQFH